MILAMKHRNNGRLAPRSFEGESTTDYKAIAEHLLNYSDEYIADNDVPTLDDAWERGDYAACYDLCAEWICVEDNR